MIPVRIKHKLYSSSLFGVCIYKKINPIYNFGKEHMIGFGDWGICNNNNLTYGDIINIQINDQFKKQGYGNYILNYIISDIKNKNVRHTVIDVHPNNMAAINLYQKNGFVILSNDEKTKYITHYGTNPFLIKMYKLI